jgi:hypothetical protein
MEQRISISPLPKESFDGPNASYVISLCMTNYMLASGACETPPIFLNKSDVQRAIRNAYEYARKLQNDSSVELQLNGVLAELEKINEKEDNLVMAVSNLSILGMEECVACVVKFTKNSLLIVGKSPQFYVVDPVHSIFYATPSPQYDIETYAKDYGNGKFDVSYYRFRLEKEKEEKKTEEEPVKKKTKVVKKKPVVVEEVVQVKKEKEEETKKD